MLRLATAPLLLDARRLVRPRGFGLAHGHANLVVLLVVLAIIVAVIVLTRSNRR